MSVNCPLNLNHRSGIGHASHVPTNSRPVSRLAAVAAGLTALTGLAIAGIGVGSAIANSKLFGIGVAAVLVGYGAAMIALSWLVIRGRAWAMGLVVAAALLHLLVVGSFLTTDDRAQFLGSLAVLPVILATVIAGVVSIGRRPS